MTAVLVMGAVPRGPFLPGPDEVVVCDLERGAPSVAWLADLTSEGIARHGTVIALVPTWRAEPATTLLRTVRSLLETNHLLLARSTLPPVALSVVASLLAALARQGVPAGILLAGLPLIERQLTVVAWLRSVSRLEDPAPDLGQHLRSWLPGNGWLVSIGERSTITPYAANLARMPGLPASRALIAVCTPAVSDTRIAPSLVKLLGSHPEVRVLPTSLSATRWGTADVIEAVSYPVDAGVLGAQVVSGCPCLPCRWCAELAGGNVCPFCGMGLVETAPVRL